MKDSTVGIILGIIGAILLGWFGVILFLIILTFIGIVGMIDFLRFVNRKHLRKGNT